MSTLVHCSKCGQQTLGSGRFCINGCEGSVLTEIPMEDERYSHHAEAMAKALDVQITPDEDCPTGNIYVLNLSRLNSRPL